jgi:hypothetical protein
MMERLQPEYFADDDVVDFRIDEVPAIGVGDPTPLRETTLPERVVARMQLLARAFELPLLSRLPWNAAERDWTFPGVQFAGILAETDFLRSIVSDPALWQAWAPVEGLLHLHRSGRAVQLVVSPP